MSLYRYVTWCLSQVSNISLIKVNHLFTDTIIVSYILLITRDYLYCILSLIINTNPLAHFNSNCMEVCDTLSW